MLPGSYLYNWLNQQVRQGWSYLYEDEVSACPGECYDVDLDEELKYQEEEEDPPVVEVVV